MSIQIESYESLLLAADYCHDAAFETDKIRYDSDKMAFSLPLTREMWEKVEKEKSILFLHRWKVPKIESVLTLYGVSGVDARNSEPQDVLVGVEYDPAEGMIRLKCMTGAELRLKVERLQGILEDVGKEYFDNTRFTTFGSKP